jgi:hypothetical protein
MTSGHYRIMITRITEAYRAIETRRSDLDQRMSALPPDDVDGRDALMVEVEMVLASRQDTLQQLVLAHPEDLAELRAKASILLALGEEDDLSELARSLAQDVLRLPDN